MLFPHLPFILFNLADMTAVSFFLIMCLWKDNSNIPERMKERKHSFITLKKKIRLPEENLISYADHVLNNKSWQSLLKSVLQSSICFMLLGFVHN